jgi:hypothetical protein
MNPGTQLLVPFIKAKINAAGEIINEKTKQDIASLIRSFYDLNKKFAHH